MIQLLQKTADRMLGALAPKAQAEACPYSEWYENCYCVRGYMFRKKCYYDCGTRWCDGCNYPYPGC